ncbi:MAG: glycosyltransferase family 39 protein [Tenericutes bacterium]|nr:glycosyltransferase family 39 protein [Mycoplasmatota bacterium]MDY5993309.1 hypothetical protein [Bacilli bacterium]
MLDKRYKSLILIIFLFLLFLLFNLILFPTNLDEIWNYGFSHNLYSGLIPYKDFNMVITPFYPFIMSLGFHIFGSSMLVFHIEHAIILICLCVLLFLLIDKKAWFIVALMLFPVNVSFPSYNIFLYFLLVLIIYLEKEKKSDYLIGFLLGLCVLTKHSVGLCLLLPSLYYIKDLKKVGRRFLGFIVPLFVFIIYLIITKSMIPFIDLCILGLFDFASENGKAFNIYFLLFIIMIGITIYFIVKDRKNLVNYYVLAFYSIMIPLFDIYHFMVAFLAFLILILSKVKKDIIKPGLFGISIILFSAVLLMDSRFKSKIIYPNNIKHFEYRFIDYDSILFTNKVNDYIKKNSDREFVFLNSNGYYFRLINDMKISYIDLINAGNFGYNGSDKLLKEIKKRKNSIFLVDKSELSPIKQSDKQALNYVIDNGKKIGNIDFFDIYVFDEEK